jgi:hypothetical protein
MIREPAIVELMLRIREVGPGEYSVLAILGSRFEHPPSFRVVRGKVEEEELWNFSADAQGKIPAEFFRRLGTPISRVQDSGAGPSWSWESEAASLLHSSFPRSVLQLFQRFLEEAEENSGLYRLNVRSELPAVLDFPWARLAQVVSTRQSFESRYLENLLCVARYPELAHSGGLFRLPLVLAIDGGREVLDLDALSQEAIRLGALEVQDARAFHQEKTILHLRDPMVGMRASHALVETQRPKLLVIQQPHSGLRISEFLRRGANAVLLASGDEAACRLFFRHFYRNVLSNWLLDKCVQKALAAVPASSVEVTFGAREGGEYGLSFTRGILEARDRAFGGELGDTLAQVYPPRRAAPPLFSRGELKIRRLGRDFEYAFWKPILEARQWMDARISADFKRLDFRGLNSREEPGELALAIEFIQEFLAKAEGVLERKEQAQKVMEMSSYLQGDSEFLQSAFTRLIEGWLSQDEQGAPVDRTRPLLQEASAWLHVKLSPLQRVPREQTPPRPTVDDLFVESQRLARRTLQLSREQEARLMAMRPPELLLDLAFGNQEDLRLDVCVFHDSRSVQVDAPRGELLLPRHGGSTEFRSRLRFEQPGQHRLRICIFHEGALLQSLVVEAEVVAKEDAVPLSKGEDWPIQYTLDYVASPDFTLLDQRPRPALSFVTNHARNGELWLGVFSSQDEGRGGLRTGMLHTFSGEQLATHTAQVRGAFETLQGGPVYFYKEPLAESNHAERARRLVQLATQGARLFNGLFNGNRMLPTEDLRALHQGLSQPGLISVARCNLAEQSIPWAMVYDCPLDTGNEKRLALCPVFLKQLEAQEDRLDTPASCRALPECPLRGPEARYTVCPFGFWGIHHQIEQPVKQLKVEDVKAPPRELISPAFVESCQILAEQQPAKAFMGCGNHVPAAEEHYQELNRLTGWSLSRSAVRDEVIAALERQPHLLYLYCHGVRSDGVFKLQFPEAPIEATSFTPGWSLSRPPFFVFLNSCESLATLPETINHFLGTLIHMGALAVIGSEIRINNLFARQFARRVLEDFLAGKKLGEAFLRARRHFLRQLNPLALAYTLHAAADVHLHGRDCAHCRTSWHENPEGILQE